MARRTVVAAPPRFEGKNPRQGLAQLSYYCDLLGLEDEESLEDVQAFLTGKALSHWCSIEEYAPELRLVDWEGFKHLMLARFSGQTVGSSIAKLQRLRYNEDFERLAEQFAEGLAEGDHPPADLALGVVSD